MIARRTGGRRVGRTDERIFGKIDDRTIGRIIGGDSLED